MAQVSGKTIVDKALFIAGVIGVGDYNAADGQEAQDALESLNFIIDTWKVDGLLNFATTVVEHSPTTGSFTIGPTGDLTAVRPPRITDAVCVINAGQQGAQRIGLVEMAVQDFDRITLPNQASNITQFFYYNPTVPNGTFHIWPVPQAGATTTIRIRYDQLVSEFTTLNTNVDLPPGYKQALIYILADQLCTQYGNDNPKVADFARKAMKTIKRNNLTQTPMIYDQSAPGVGGGLFNVQTDNWV